MAPPARAKQPPQPVLAAEKKVQLEDRVSLERVYLVWPSAPLFAPGDAELDSLASVLGGKSGRLYKRLVYDARIAQTVEVGQASSPLSSQFQVVVTMKPGHKAAEAVPIVDEELAKVRNEAVSAAELEKAKNGYESQFVFGLMSGQRRADELNRYAYYAGDPGFIDKDLERYRAVGADGVRSWAQKTIVPGRVVVTVSPEGSQVMRRLLMLAAFVLSCAHVPPASTENVPSAWPEARADAGNAPATTPTTTPKTPPTRGPLPITKTPGGAVIKGGTPPPVVPLQQPKDDFDRTKPPKGGPPPKLNLPVPARRKLKNGAALLVVERHELPLASLVVTWPTGIADEPPAQAGIAGLTADMLDEGAGKRGALDIAEEVARHGAGFQTSASWDDTRVQVTALTSRSTPSCRSSPTWWRGRRSPTKSSSACAPIASRR